VALPRLTYAIDAAVAIKCFGVATSYLLVIGDQMPSVVRTALLFLLNPAHTRRGLEASPPVKGLQRFGGREAAHARASRWVQARANGSLGASAATLPSPSTLKKAVSSSARPPLVNRW